MVKVKIQLTSLFIVDKGLPDFFQRQAESYGSEIAYALQKSTVGFPRVPQVGDKVRLYHYLPEVSEATKEYAQKIRHQVFPVLAVEDQQIHYFIKLGQAEMEVTPLGF